MKLKIFALFIIPFILATFPSDKKVKEVAKNIKKGKIKLEEEVGLDPDKRWHTIHSELLEIDCESCHIEKYEENYLYQRKYKVPVEDAPGVVKREVCITCHREDGPALTKLYGKEEK